MPVIAYSDGYRIVVRQDFYSLSGDAQFLVLQHECEHREGANEQQAMFYSAYRFCGLHPNPDDFFKVLVQLRPALFSIGKSGLEAEENRGYAAGGCTGKILTGHPAASSKLF